MPIGQLPQHDRVPQTELLVLDTTPITVASDWTPFHETGEAEVFVPNVVLSTPGQSLLGHIVLRMRGITRPRPYNATVDYFTVSIGGGADAYVIDHTFHPWSDCNDREFTVLRAYPQSALAENLVDPLPPDFLEGGVATPVRWRGGSHRFDECEGIPEVQVELQYDQVILGSTTESRDLQLWGEDLCQNVIFAPSIPPLGHNRMVGFFDDNGQPIPGRHRLPENFCELLSTHAGRMIDEEGSASEEVCKHSYASMVVSPDGYARGYFCSNPESLSPRAFQQNHYGHPFVQMGENDEVEPTPLQKDFSVSQQIPRGMCAFIGSYHAPRWTELLYYSHREICEAIV